MSATHTKGNQNPPSFTHVGDPSGCMSDPTVDRLEIAVEVYAPVDICDQNAIGQWNHSRDFLSYNYEVR